MQTNIVTNGSGAHRNNLNSAPAKKKKGKRGRGPWTPEQHRRFKEAMAKRKAERAGEPAPAAAPEPTRNAPPITRQLPGGGTNLHDAIINLERAQAIAHNPPTDAELYAMIALRLLKGGG